MSVAKLELKNETVMIMAFSEAEIEELKAALRDRFSVLRGLRRISDPREWQDGSFEKVAKYNTHLRRTRDVWKEFQKNYPDQFNFDDWATIDIEAFEEKFEGILHV